MGGGVETLYGGIPATYPIGRTSVQLSCMARRSERSSRISGHEGNYRADGNRAWRGQEPGTRCFCAHLGPHRRGGDIRCYLLISAGSSLEAQTIDEIFHIRLSQRSLRSHAHSVPKACPPLCRYGVLGAHREFTEDAVHTIYLRSVMLKTTILIVEDS